MGKMPVLRLVGCCCLGVVLAGCTNVPKQTYTGGTQNGSTFGSNTGKPPLTADTAAPAKPPGSGLSQVQGAGAPADGGPSGLAPRNDGLSTARSIGGSTPGEAGLVGGPPGGVNDVSKKSPPMSGTDDVSQVTTSRAPGAAAGVTFPSPPPSANNTMQLPATGGSSLDQRPTTRTTALPMVSDDLAPPAAPSAPAGTTPTPPPTPLIPSAMKPAAYGDGPIHTAPTPPQAGTPAMPAPIDASALPPSPTPAAPTAPTGPFMPGGAK